jgi:hypothetical protein
VKGKEQYEVKISGWFAALANSDVDVDVNRTWEVKPDGAILLRVDAP